MPQRALPSQAMVECPDHGLQKLPNDLQQRADADPEVPYTLILEAKVTDNRKYMDCKRRHHALIQWVLEGRK